MIIEAYQSALKAYDSEGGSLTYLKGFGNTELLTTLRKEIMNMSSEMSAEEIIENIKHFYDSKKINQEQ